MPDKKEQWKDIPGYGGWYQISTEGRLRSFRGYGGRRLEIPRPLSASIKKPGTISEWLAVTLTDENGHKRSVSVTKLMGVTWMNGPRPGYVVFTKNRNRADARLSNLCWMKRAAIVEHMRSKHIQRKSFCKKFPVIKIDLTLAVIEAYPSARQASLDTHISRHTIQSYCNREPKNSVIAPDGYIYAWDDTRRIWATLRRAMRELDEMGIRYNDPHTGRYFDLPEDIDISIDAGDLAWTETPALAAGGARFGAYPMTFYIEKGGGVHGKQRLRLPF